MSQLRTQLQSATKCFLVTYHCIAKHYKALYNACLMQLVPGSIPGRGKCDLDFFSFPITEDFQDDRYGSHLISERNNFSNFKSQCGTNASNASHQVLAQSNLGFGSRCGFKIFKMVAQAGISWIVILNLYVAPMLPIKFQLNPTYGFRGDVV